MKKLLFAGAVLGCASFTFADDACSGEFAPGHGFYIGGGVVGVDSGATTDYRDHDSYEMPVHGITGQDANANDDDGRLDARKVAARDLVAHPDRVFIDTYRREKGMLVRECSASGTRLGGTFVVGYAHQFSDAPMSIGLELGADISSSTESVGKGSSKITGWDELRNWSATQKQNGFRPFGAVVMGYTHDNAGMVYVKLGATRSKVATDYLEYDLRGDVLEDFSGTQKSSKLRPLIGLGYAKALSSSVTGRVELEYVLPSSKKHDFKSDVWESVTETEPAWAEIDPSDNADLNMRYSRVLGEKGGNINLKQKGEFKVRALVTWGVKI